MSLFRPMINLGNSIVGVSILTMPWCITQCGIVLGVLLLILSALFTTWTCKMLLRAAHMTRQHTYETLGHAVYGSLGKLGIEISNIGLGIGTCVAFYIIIGDLLPPLVAQFLGINWDPRVLRGVLLVLSAVFVAFPLTLIRNVDKLSVISVGSLVFYLFFITQLVLSSRKHLTWEVLSRTVWWQNMGILKCLPIFSLAFCCQSQMFVIYTSLREGSVRKMSTVVDGAIWMITAAYFSVAVFGYLSYCTEEIKGDVLSNFPLNSLSQVTRFGFAVTVMLSFPLIVFPCRVSLNSLLCAEGSMELHVTPPIPQGRFVAITAGIMFTTLTLAILIPHIQTVLALVGATLGSLICFIFPGLFLTKVAGSNTEFSYRARFCIGLGMCVLVLSTVVTLNSWSEEGTVHYHIKPAPDIVTLPPTSIPPENSLPILKKDIDNQDDVLVEKDTKNGVKVPLDVKADPVIDSPENESVQPPGDSDKKKEQPNLDGKLENLAKRLEKLEEENKDLKERQNEMEKDKGNKAPDIQARPVRDEDDTPLHLMKEEIKDTENLEEPVKDKHLKVYDKQLFKDSNHESQEHVTEKRISKMDSQVENIPGKFPPKSKSENEVVRADVDQIEQADKAPAHQAEKAPAGDTLPSPAVQHKEVDEKIKNLEIVDDLKQEELSKENKKHMVGGRDLKSA